jgi:hypothetical protein
MLHEAASAPANDGNIPALSAGRKHENHSSTSGLFERFEDISGYDGFVP